ncbi:MAG: TatD family hydrolase [Candidatus Caenarcaniphilales bacterium]|nr:TatD family hydrolase [Candidatus Caenarcaniphilales bacterium]
MPTLIDTHAHICFDSYDQDREAMMARAFDQGVKKLVHPCCNLEEIDFLLELTKKYDGNNCTNVFTAFGLHPTEIEKWNDDSKSILDARISESLARGEKLKAVGETGLDYYHCKEEHEQKKQKEVFESQIQLAIKYNLPIIVHTRDAWQDTLSILEKFYKDGRDKTNGTIHCFTGDLEFAQSCIQLGFFISWSGVLSYKKNDHFREIASKLDLNRVLIETDCPFLAPQSKRGKRNEPSFVQEVAEILADCYKISVEELGETTSRNAEKLFNI